MPQKKLKKFASSSSSSPRLSCSQGSQDPCCFKIPFKELSILILAVFLLLLLLLLLLRYHFVCPLSVS